MRFRIMFVFLVSVWGLGLSRPVFAAETSSNVPPHAIASATATGEFEYDEARLTFSVNNEGPDAADLTAKLAKKSASLVEALKALGLTDADLRVTGPSISVRYAMIRNTNGMETIDRQRIDGFTGFISVSGRFKEFSKLGKAMSDGVKLGAAISGPSFSLSAAKSDEKLADLAVDATKAALANAKAMIDATGRKPGRVLEIRTEAGFQPTPDAPMRALAMAAPAADIQVPVNPGRATLSRVISVTVEIIEP